MTERTGIDSSAAYTLDGIGMGKTEFRIKRLGEKLRFLCAKGGELATSMDEGCSGERGRVRSQWYGMMLRRGARRGGR